MEGACQRSFFPASRATIGAKISLSGSKIEFFLLSRGWNQPRLKFFAPGMLQATYWRSQHALQRISTCLGDLFETGQVGGLAFLREKLLDGGIPKNFKQGDDHPRSLIRIGSREDAFPGPLTDNLLEKGVSRLILAM